ncbi:MAG: hypothetical protein J0L72_03985 [Armatimonadetes bacterium]|nr:hypothetical protein [Armatimonadota bacterium]
MKKKFGKRLGMSTPAVMLFMISFAGVSMYVASSTMQSDKHSDRTASKSQADLLAESAVNDLYDRIRAQMWADQTYPFSISNGSLSGESRSGSIVLGSYTARVVSMTRNIADVGNSPPVRRINYTFVLEGTGTSQYGVVSRKQAKFLAVMEYNLQSITNIINQAPPADKITFPAGAVVANGKVIMKTSGGFRTFSPDGLKGHVIGNGGIQWDPNGTKSTNRSPNVMDTQGLMMTPARSFDWTVSDAGIGNANGTINYRTPVVSSTPGLPNVAANSVVKLAQDVGFANSAKVDLWTNNWRTTTTKPSAYRFNGGLKSNTMSGRPGDGWKVIETPAYIDGDLEVTAGDLLRLVPTSSNPTENIVYVSGNVKNVGQLMNLGVTLVVNGKYIGKHPGEYKLDTNGSPYPTRSKVLQNSALISVNTADDAIDYQHETTATTGLIYAAKGGMKIKKSPELNGMILAYKDIEVETNNSFVVRYEPDAASAGDFDPGLLTQINVSLVPAGVRSPFNPSKLTEWLTLK